MSEDFKERGRKDVIWHGLAPGHGWSALCGEPLATEINNDGHQITTRESKINCQKCIELANKEKV